MRWNLGCNSSGCQVSEVSAVLFTGSGLPDALAAVVKGQERESVAGLLEHGVVPGFFGP